MRLRRRWHPNWRILVFTPSRLVSWNEVEFVFCSVPGVCSSARTSRTRSREVEALVALLQPPHIHQPQPTINPWSRGGISADMAMKVVSAVINWTLLFNGAGGGGEGGEEERDRKKLGFQAVYMYACAKKWIEDSVVASTSSKVECAQICSARLLHCICGSTIAQASSQLAHAIKAGPETSHAARLERHRPHLGRPKTHACDDGGLVEIST